MTFRLPVDWERAIKTSQKTDHHLAKTAGISAKLCREHRESTTREGDALVEQSLGRFDRRAFPLLLVDPSVGGKGGGGLCPASFLSHAAESQRGATRGRGGAKRENYPHIIVTITTRRARFS